jgi:hypothetical protein
MCASPTLSGRPQPFVSSGDELNPDSNLFRSKKCKILSERVDDHNVIGFCGLDKISWTVVGTWPIVSPSLLHPDPTKPFYVKADASNFAIAAILSQPDEVSVLHPMAYDLRTFTVLEIKYLIYDKELLTIITPIEEWRSYLTGVQHRIQVVIDHKNLMYFSTTWNLNRR